MRQPIDTAPRDGNVIILEDDATGTYDVAHWTAEAADWISESGGPSKRRAPPQGHTAGDPTPPHPAVSAVPVAVAAAGARTPSAEAERLPSSKRRLAMASLAAALVVAVLTATYFSNEDVSIVKRYVGQSTDVTHAPILTQGSQLPGRDSNTVHLRAEPAKSAQSLEQERQKAAAVAKEAAAARQELTAGMTRHRQELDEERARSAALASELATARREIEKQAALLKASDETGQLTQAESAKSAQSLEQERQKAAGLAQEAAAARQELTASTTRHRQCISDRMSNHVFKTKFSIADWCRAAGSGASDNQS